MSIATLYQNAADVCLRLSSHTAGTDFRLVYNAGAEWAARLLHADLRERLSQRMRQIRQEAYAQGWKDAKAKRRKETWFSGELP
jgi:hypothetical protein